jgi:hypothetical protein
VKENTKGVRLRNFKLSIDQLSLAEQAVACFLIFRVFDSSTKAYVRGQNAFQGLVRVNCGLNAS